ncbi:DUF4127 family protein [Microbacterium sp. SLBN-154]|uniref:DUF4127 family protein n=1 Tax=Microbacterium sp. SLBN-154 TaxID=2768458 RepID=UPI00135C7923|nr:DUF4127 family protein [Microbacterium sp. SLBN-154]
MLVPLDERPVCLDLPRRIAAIAGFRMDVPPPVARPDLRHGGDLGALTTWLEAALHDDGEDAARAAVVSLDGLGFGGLIPSRIGAESAAAVLARFDVLRDSPAPVYASIVVPRAPDAADDFEEPLYWAEWGPALHALSLHLGGGGGGGRIAEIPDDVRADWLRRRLRQHVIALGAVGMVADGTLRRLFVGVDDAVPGSLSERDQMAVVEWIARLGVTSRARVAPGADETGAVLTARAIGEQLQTRPSRIAVLAADPRGLERVAPYETGPVGDTARAQLDSAGAELVADPSEADGILLVHTPDGTSGDWAVSPPERTDAAAADATAALAASLSTDGRIAVAVADVAQPNGADPALVRALARRHVLADLDGYAAWNTAGNTIGTAAAHLVTALAARRAGVFDGGASARLVRTRVIEDYGYMSAVRRQLRARIGSPVERHDRIEDVGGAAAFVAAALTDALAPLASAGIGRVTASDISFPWRRSFEIALSDTAGESA